MANSLALRDRAETLRHVSLDKLLALDRAAPLRAMETLEPQQREMVRQVFSEHTFADIARREGVDRSAVRKRMERLDAGGGAALLMEMGTGKTLTSIVSALW